MSSTSTRGASRKPAGPAVAGRRGGAAAASGRATSARPPAARPARAVHDPLLTWQRVLLLAVIPVTALAFSKGLADSVTLPKLTFLVLLVLALAVLTTVRTVRGGRITLPTGPLVYALAFFLLGLVLATVTAHKTSLAVLGVSGRGMGLLLYASGVLLALGVLRWFDADALRLVARTLLGAAAGVAAYGLLQAAGADPVDWNNQYNSVISTLGNPNFSAAYTGLVVAVAGWGVLTRTWHVAWRVVAGVIGAASLAVSVLAESVQGPIAAAVGLVVLLAAWLLDRPRSVRTPALGVLALGTLAGGALGVAGLTGSGPLASALDTNTLQFRKWYWSAAVDMWRDAPVLGVGLDNYADFYRLHRTQGATVQLGYNSVADNAHNVPLQLLSGGGVVLLAGWLALVLLTLVALVRGLRRLEGERRLLLGGLGGAWAAYQVQSLVSLDVPALSVLHFVLAASVFVLAWPPGERALAVPTRARGGAPNGLGWAAVGLVSLLALVGAYQAVQPWRADAAVLRAEQAAAVGDGTTAIEELEKARALAPYEHRFWYKQGEVFDRASQPEDGAKSFARAVTVNDRMWEAAVRAAQDFQAAGDLEKADEFYARSFVIDPTTPEILVDGAAVALELGDAERAEGYLRDAIAVNPELPQAWSTLGRALAAQQDKAGAADAYRQALELEPGRPDATEGLAALQSS